MAIKTMLVPLDGSAGSEAVLDTAFALARRFSAHVDVLHVRLPSDPLHSVTEGWWLSDETRQWVLEIAGRGAAEAAAKVRAAFHDYCAARDIAIAETPPSPAAVSAAGKGGGWEPRWWRARLADRRAAARAAAAVVQPEASLETRRPIFVAPPTPPSGSAPISRRRTAAGRPAPSRRVAFLAAAGGLC
jgi:nucleotide-binding universal stress UspA family protein